jgi:hypothetical protein
MNALLNNWYILYIATTVLSIILIYTKGNINDNVYNFGSWLVGILGLSSIILYIIWLTQFNNKNVLQSLWISTLIATIVLSASLMFINDTNLQDSLKSLIGMTTILFFGALIAFFTKK